MSIDIKPQDNDLRALTEAFETFTRTTRDMEAAYARLESRLEQMDRELAAKNLELALTRDYLNDILESMSDGVIAIDAEGVVTAFNRAASDILGVESEDALSHPFREVLGRPFAAPDGAIPQELHTTDGRTITIFEQDSPIIDREGARLGTVKVFQDLTEVEKLRQRIRSQDRLAAVGEMAATVAHEIRNPLGGIRGFGALLARDIDESDPRRRLVDKIQTGAQHLERVVNELLEFTRPVQLRPRATPLADVVESAVGYIELRDGIVVKNRVPKDLYAIADPDKLRQVLLNVLLNAAQSIEGNGEVSICGGAEDGLARLSITDTGCGMDAETARNVFSPFFTTKEKGTGLGLAVARNIVEGHGGKIEVTSEVGRGSTFTMYLAKAEG